MLYACLAKFTQDDEYAWGWTPRRVEIYLTAGEEEWGTGIGAEYLAPSLAADEAYRSWFARLLRLSASPRMALALLRMNTEIDVRAVLPSVRAPTLVLHRTGDLFVAPGHSGYLARHVPGAQRVELPGDDHWPWAGDAEAVVGRLQEFVTGVRFAPEVDRVLTTVLFTDIVASTERAAELGDRRWRDILESHRLLVRRELARFRGREIETVGDGFFGASTGPPGRSAAPVPPPRPCGHSASSSARAFTRASAKCSATGSPASPSTSGQGWLPSPRPARCWSHGR